MAASKNDCGYTIKTLKEWVELRTKEMDNRLGDYKLFIAEKFKSGEGAVRAAMEAAKEAVTKAEAATEERFRTVDEFRGTLSDQTATFVPRNEFETALRAITDKVDLVKDSITDNRGRIASLESASTGRKEGQAALWGYVVGAVGILAFIIQAYLHGLKP